MPWNIMQRDYSRVPSAHAGKGALGSNALHIVMPLLCHTPIRSHCTLLLVWGGSQQHPTGESPAVVGLTALAGQGVPL